MEDEHIQNLVQQQVNAAVVAALAVAFNAMPALRLNIPRLSRVSHDRTWDLDSLFLHFLSIFCYIQVSSNLV